VDALPRGRGLLPALSGGVRSCRLLDRTAGRVGYVGPLVTTRRACAFFVTALARAGLHFGTVSLGHGDTGKWADRALCGFILPTIRLFRQIPGSCQWAAS
jgi:hypothetical protein